MVTKPAKAMLASSNRRVTFLYAGMEYKKPPKSVKDQVTLLQARGLQISDVAIAEHYLLHLNYYRLAGYWFPYEENHATHTFKPNVL